MVKDKSRIFASVKNKEIIVFGFPFLIVPVSSVHHTELSLPDLPAYVEFHALKAAQRVR